MGIRKAATRRWERNNPEKFEAQKMRRRVRAAGVPEHQVDEMVARLRNTTACELCQRSAEEVGGRWNGTYHVDHCHRTGVFRGILCAECNLALGKFQDSPDVLRRAISYLERHKLDGAP